MGINLHGPSDKRACVWTSEQTGAGRDCNLSRAAFGHCLLPGNRDVGARSMSGTRIREEGSSKEAQLQTNCVPKQKSGGIWKHPFTLSLAPLELGLTAQWP